ncbi:MAG: serine/threonine protein kinase [Phycisphaerales bacterium]|nr:serine/threonine protein kinase [Phycisphaerales bacterium]
MSSADDRPNPSDPAENDPIDSGVFYAPDGQPAGTGGRRLPERIGPYRIIRQLGQGGMGVVYLAEQEEPIRRQIALKLVKLGMDTEQVVSRFRSERQAMAMMDHPGIARVYDAGATELGRPYFIMEYVEGTPVTSYCDRMRLDTRARLRLFVEICHAVQHAHQKGVIHRDLKPSNVLVSEADGGPQPKVIDFGIAKATEGSGLDITRHTADGQFVGTPEYMSPEQISGQSDLDTRTDVYSLGVLLYELLAGARPLDFRADSVESIDLMRRRVREEEPRRPSTRVTERAERAVQVARRRRSEPEALRNLLKGDLDWIVMKAMDKDRNRRYPSASEFAADVHRFLDCEPVRAAPPSTHYRLRKFVRRNRGPVLAAGLLAVALVAGTITSLALYLRAEEARIEAQRNSERVAVVNDFLIDMLNAADPSEMGRDVRVLDLLAGAAARLEGRFADEPDLEAGARYAIGSTYRGLGMYEQSIEQLSRSVDLYTESVGPDDPLTIDAMSTLASALHDDGRYEEADDLIRDAMARSDARPRENLDSGLLRSQLGANLTAMGRYDEAGPVLEEALDITTRLAGRRSLASAGGMLNLGQFELARGDYDRAIPLHLEALQIRKDLLGSRHPLTLNALCNYGLVLLEAGQAEKAEPYLREGVEVSREVRGPSHQLTLLAINNLAGSLFRQDKTSEVETLLSDALASMREAVGEEHRLTLAFMHNLGVMKQRNGKPDEAETLLRRALALREDVLGQGHRDVAYSAAALGGLLLAEGRPDEAIAPLRLGVRIFTEVAGEDFGRTITGNLDLADALLQTGEVEEARRLLESVHPLASGAAAERCDALLAALVGDSGPAGDSD